MTVTRPQWHLGSSCSSASVCQGLEGGLKESRSYLESSRPQSRTVGGSGLSRTTADKDRSTWAFVIKVPKPALMDISGQCGQTQGWAWPRTFASACAILIAHIRQR